MGDVLGYARVSTGDQDLTGQRLRLESAGAIGVFEDVRSGKSMDRPRFADLLAHARKGDTLAVVRLDRFGRSGRTLVDGANAEGAWHRLRQPGGKIDTSAAGELVFHVFGAIAHFERRLIAERTRDGIAAAREKAKCRGAVHLIWRRSRRQSSPSRPDRRQRRPPGSWAAGAQRSIGRSQPMECEGQLDRAVPDRFALSVTWRTINAMPSSKPAKR